MFCVGAARARLQRPSPQDGGWWVGVERRRAGRGERGRQGRRAGPAGETPHACFLNLSTQSMILPCIASSQPADGDVAMLV